MTREEIEAAYQRTYAQWEEEQATLSFAARILRLEEPLPFEVPEEAMTKLFLGSVGGVGEGSFITEKRFYRVASGNTRSLLKGSSLFVVILTIVLCVLLSSYWPLLLLLVIPVLRWYWLTMPINDAPTIFDREKGLIYENCETEYHQAYNFYDAQFFIEDRVAGYSRTVMLKYYLRWKDEEGRWHKNERPIHLVFSGTSRSEALNDWYFLVRYMDKSNQFTEEQLSFFEYKKNQLKNLPFKVPGMTYPDGRVEWLN